MCVGGGSKDFWTAELVFWGIPKWVTCRVFSNLVTLLSKRTVPCYEPCAGRAGWPTPMGEDPRTCARAPDKDPLHLAGCLFASHCKLRLMHQLSSHGQTHLHDHLPARAEAVWEGKGVGRRRWSSSPSHQSSSHCSDLSHNRRWTRSIFFKATLYLTRILGPTCVQKHPCFVIDICCWCCPVRSLKYQT